MPYEIEKKFLVNNDTYKNQSEGEFIQQGFLSLHKERIVRVRVAGDKATLTIKGIAIKAARREYEYNIPMKDAQELLHELCEKPLIIKTRHIVEFKGHTWEVDEFLGENKGLVIAEIELDHEAEQFEMPAWIGKEVTGDPRYYNMNLVFRPYSRWNK